jgi:hypothetical protein
VPATQRMPSSVAVGRDRGGRRVGDGGAAPGGQREPGGGDASGPSRRRCPIAAERAPAAGGEHEGVGCRWTTPPPRRSCRRRSSADWKTCEPVPTPPRFVAVEQVAHAGLAALPARAAARPRAGSTIGETEPMSRSWRSSARVRGLEERRAVGRLRWGPRRRRRGGSPARRRSPGCGRRGGCELPVATNTRPVSSMADPRDRPDARAAAGRGERGLLRGVGGVDADHPAVVHPAVAVEPAEGDEARFPSGTASAPRSCVARPSKVEPPAWWGVMLAG